VRNLRIYRLLAATTLTLAAMLSATTPALADQHPAPRNGICEQGEFCYYYNSNNQGSISDFADSISDYGTSQPNCYDFKGVGNGRYQCIKNNAASVWNRSSKTVRVHYNSGYSGSYQSVPPSYKGNLNSTLYNENASHKFVPNDPREPATDLTFSSAGASFIAAFEGFRATVYNDAGGHCTIGYGHLIHRGGCTSRDASNWGTISRERGLALLKSDANSFASGIRSRLGGTRLYQYEFDALVSFVYNIGLGGFDSSSVKRDLLSVPTDYASVPADMKKWVYSNGQFLCGLYKRRVNEGNLFRTGSYTIRSVTCPSPAGAGPGEADAVSANPRTPEPLRPSVAPGARP